jgi:SAM-dependent methyltransferase
MSSERTPIRALQEKLYKPLRGLPEDRFVPRMRGKVIDWVADRVFERGLETSRTEVELDHFHPDRVTYEASGWLDLRRALRKRAIRPTDVFLDFGSGKGRVVYQAARYPFARVIGVEISPKLNDLARRNIERNRHKLACRNIELVTIDAREFEIPDDVTIVYLYHPFGGETFETVIGNIIESLDRCHRQLTLVYQMPWREDQVLATGRFKLIRTLKRRRRDPRRIAVYAGLPARDEGSVLSQATLSLGIADREAEQPDRKQQSEPTADDE